MLSPAKSVVGYLEYAYGNKFLPLAAVVDAFHGSKFHGLLLCDLVCRAIARISHQQDAGKPYPRSDAYALQGIADMSSLQEEPGRYAYNEYGSQHPAGCYGVEKLVERDGRQGNGGKVGHFVAHGVGVECHAGRILHPCVGYQYPQCRYGCAQAGKPRRGEVEPFAHLVPSEEHDGEEGRFHKKGHDALYGEGGSEYVAYKPAVIRPVGAELKFEDDTRGHADGEIDTEEFHPKFGDVFPLGFSRTVIDGFHDTYDNGKAERQRYEEPVIHGGESKLRS